MSVSARSLFVAALTSAVAFGAVGCGQEEIQYEPRKPVSGAKADMPPVPNVPQKPVKDGDAYTVWGAGYHLRSRVHRKDIAGNKLSLVGYVVKTNLADAPEGAVHKGGEAGPEGCNAPIPAFWIADSKEASPNDSIKVMGWASNFAQIYDAIQEYDKQKGDEAEHQDAFWGVKLPNPLPAQGAKVKVTGRYSTTFTGASTGAEADPIMGIMTYEAIEFVEPPPEPATLPGVKRKAKS